MAPQASVPPDQAQIEVANGFYSREMYDLAAAEYENYLRNFPGSPDRLAAMFRLAECYRVAKKIKPARDLYESIVIESNQGEFAGNAAFRLGDIYIQERNYKGALPMFEKAASLVKDPKIAIAARYNEARTLDMLGRRTETLQVYGEIIQAGKTPFRDDARMSLASRYVELGRQQDALSQYESLATEAEKPEVRAYAAVRSADLSTQLGKPEKAAVYYAQAAKTDKGGKWQGIGIAGQLQTLYETGKFQQIINVFEDAKSAIPTEALPSALVLLGNAHRQLNDYDAALKIYDSVIREYPSSKERGEASFQRLVCLNAQKSPDLVKEIDKFLSSSSDPDASNQVRLLKAEILFNQDKFAEAGPLYLQLSTSPLDPKYRAEAVFKLGWCYAQAQQFEKAIEAYTLFVGDFRQHPYLPAAYAQRGIAYTKLKNYERALTDFDTIIINHLKAKERELALYNKALIFGIKNQDAQMYATFQQLVKDYPESTFTGEAYYWLGRMETDQKRYDKALDPLKKSRAANKNFYAKATLWIILCHYYLENRSELAKEIDDYVAAKAMPPVPSEVAGWLGVKLLSENNTPDAVRYLSIAAEGMASPDVYLALGRAQLNMSNWKDAAKALTEYLKTASSPVDRAKGLLLLGEAQIGTKEFAPAKSTAEQILQLQPEGRLNAEGRLLKGEVEFAAAQYNDASKTFSSVAVMFDDPAITPRALERAAAAFSKAGRPLDADKMMKELKQRFPEYSSTDTEKNR